MLKKLESIQKFTRYLSTSRALLRYNKPISENVLSLAAGISSMYRLPVYKDSKDLDACFVGIPLDCGTTFRSGARFGPKQIRGVSSLIGEYNADTGAKPYDSLQVGDVGDMTFNQFNLPLACKQIKESYLSLIKDGDAKVLAMGGDHTVTYPILQAIKEKYGPVSLIHVDAHTDIYGPVMGSEIQHGNPFLLAYQENLIDPNKTIQIGVRPSGDLEQYEEAKKLGFRVVPARDCWWKSLTPLMEEVREMIGDLPVYISFDIDSIDPSYAPGTGTPVIGGLSTVQALEIIRGCKGLNIVGCDLVEVSPPYDNAANITSLLAASLLYEMLCVLPGVEYN